jgi:hypothetical protein
VCESLRDRQRAGDVSGHEHGVFRCEDRYLGAAVVVT